MTGLTETMIARQFALLEQAAEQGTRCPMSYPKGPINRGVVGELVARGMIKSEVSGQNYRVVTILKGPQAGKQTAPNPTGAKIFRIHAKPRSPREYPGGTVTKPRVLTQSELET